MSLVCGGENTAVVYVTAPFLSTCFEQYEVCYGAAALIIYPKYEYRRANLFRAASNCTRGKVMKWWLIPVCCLGLLLNACGLPTEAIFPERRGSVYDPRPTEEQESIFGPGGLGLFGSKEEGSPGSGGGIGVNSFLWRASLDTLAFMPLTSADPFGGVIITDWYAPPATPNERFKLTVFILDRQLSANAIRVSVFRQERKGTDWVDAVVRDETITGVEDAILTGARHLRIKTIGGS